MHDVSTSSIHLAATHYECERVVIDFSAAFDANDLAGMERVFAADGVWKRKDGDIVGIEQLRTFMRVRSPGIFVRHVLSNLRTTLNDGDSATVISYLTVYRHDFEHAPKLPAPFDGPDLVSEYHDKLARISGDWKLVLRESRSAFKR
jgi:hypothetical protein